MSTDRNWKQELAAMERFISEHPEIGISATEISIPQEFREEFYRRFDLVRGAVVDEHYSGLPVDVEALSRRFTEIEKEIVDLLGIERISMPVDLYSFLHNPKEGMARKIYSRLFELLQGKITPEFFEAQCVQELNSAASDLYRLGYEWWAGLTLIKLLEPEKAFFVDLDPDNKPFLTELRELSFGRQAHHPTMRIPELVLNSRKLGKYVAIKMAVAREVETYVVRFRPPVRPKKPTGDTSLALDSRVMLLSFMSNPNDIPIIADIYDRILNSPDWMVECVTADELDDPDAMGQIRQRYDAMNPKLGVSLLVMNASPDRILEPAGSIRPAAVGLDEANLHSVLSSLA